MGYAINPPSLANTTLHHQAYHLPPRLSRLSRLPRLPHPSKGGYPLLTTTYHYLPSTPSRLPPPRTKLRERSTSGFTIPSLPMPLHLPLRHPGSFGNSALHHYLVVFSSQVLSIFVPRPISLVYFFRPWRPGGVCQAHRSRGCHYRWQVQGPA
jgi:hypothetical protein